jgi:hypothetical protein
MGKQDGGGRNVARLVFWEAWAVTGLIHMLHFAPAGNKTSLYFLYNALAFLVLYPSVYLYKWIPLPGLLRMILIPLDVCFHTLLLLSSFLWLGYVVFVFWPSFFPFLVSNAIVLCVFWALLYMTWVRYGFGTARAFMAFGPLLVLTFWVAAGGALGFFGGRWLVEHIGNHIGSDSVKLLVWVLLVLTGMSGAALMAPKKTGDGKSA